MKTAQGATRASPRAVRAARIAAAFGLAVDSPEAERLITQIDADVAEYRRARAEHEAQQRTVPKAIDEIRRRLKECHTLLGQAPLTGDDDLTTRVMRNQIRELIHYADGLYPRGALTGRAKALRPVELVRKLKRAYEDETGREVRKSKRGPFARLVRIVLPGVDPWPAIQFVIFWDKFLRGDPETLANLKREADRT
jgi:hypothetical protein